MEKTEDGGGFMKNIIIIGAGGVGKEVAWIIEQINEVTPTYKILGFIDDSKDKKDTAILGYKVLGNIEYLYETNYTGNVIIAIANYKFKKLIAEKLKKLDIKFSTIIHPSLRLHKSVEVGEGSILYEGSVISPNVKIGEHVIISPKCGIGHDSIIEDYVSLLWNVSISGNDIIKEGSLLGSGAVVIQNKKIIKETTIGAGAVVVKDIEEAGIYKGIPAVK